MHKFIIATLATVALAEHTMVSQKLAQLSTGDDWPLGTMNTPEGDGYLYGTEDDYPFALFPPYPWQSSNDEDKPDALTLAQDLIVKSKPDELTPACNCFDGYNHSTRSLSKNTDPISAFYELTGILIPRFFRQGTAIAYDFNDIYELVSGETSSISIDMLLHFEKYHSVMDLFCTQRSCTGDVDLMGDRFETIERMSEEDIELAINVYNIADRHEIVLVEPEKIMNELVEVITDETGLTKSVVELVIESAQEFETFLQLLKKAKQLTKEGKTVDEDSLGFGRPDLDILYPIMDETRELMDAIKGASDIILP